MGDSDVSTEVPWELKCLGTDEIRTKALIDFLLVILYLFDLSVAEQNIAGT